MTKHIPLTVVFETVENGWTQATIAELPSVITAAPSRGEAKELVVDALHEFLRSLERAPDVAPGADSEPVELLITG
jgi:hypothetical protein